MFNSFVYSCLQLNMFYYIPISLIFGSFFLLFFYVYYSYINNLEQRNYIVALLLCGVFTLFIILLYSSMPLYLMLVKNPNLMFLDLAVLFTYSNLLFSVEFYIYNLTLLILGLTIIVLVFSIFYFSSERFYVGEYIVLIYLALFGMVLLLYSNDFITMYLALELQSLSLYVLASIKRNKLLSLESGLKYFATGSFSSGLLVFGISLLYGLMGSTNYSDLIFLVSSFTLDYGLFWYYLALYLILSGLLFKVAAFPFHFWAPDVYEGAPTIVTFFFILVPKVAFVGLLMKLLVILFIWGWGQFQTIMILISLGSLVVGTFGALYQVKIKRLLAYSAIVHIGYILLALSFGYLESFIVSVNYLLVYIILSLSTFSIVLAVRRKASKLLLKNIYEMSIISRSNLLMAWIFVMGLFSLAGVPPLVGFYGKFFIFYNLTIWSNFGLFLFVLIISVIGSIYYIRMIQILFFSNIRIGVSLANIPWVFGACIILFAYLNIGGMYVVQLFKFY